MFGYSVVTVIIIIAVFALVIHFTASLYHKRVAPVVKFARFIDATTDAGYKEVIAICQAAIPANLRDAVTIEATSTIGLSGGQFALFAASPNAADTNVYVGVSPTGKIMYFVFARDQKHAHILTDTFAFIAANASTQSRAPDTEPWRIHTICSHEHVSYTTRATLRKIAPPAPAPLIAPIDMLGDTSRATLSAHPATITAILTKTVREMGSRAPTKISATVTLYATSARNVFMARVALTDVGYVVIDGSSAYLVDGKFGAIFHVNIMGLSKSIAWPANVPLAEFFKWSISV